MPCQITQIPGTRLLGFYRFRHGCPTELEMATVGATIETPGGAVSVYELRLAVTAKAEYWVRVF